MTNIQILDPYCMGFRSFKCGAIIGGVLQGIMGMGSSAMANATNSQIARDTNAANERMNAENNETNLKINEATNQTNLDIAKAANDLNLSMFREQNEWNENMWNLQNEYNDPSNQMERLKLAGINPALSSGSLVDPGNNQDAVESATWAGAESAHMNPIMLTAGHNDPYQVAAIDVGFLPALAQAAGIAKTQAETLNTEMDTYMRPVAIWSEADEKSANAAVSRYTLEHLLPATKGNLLAQRRVLRWEAEEKRSNADLARENAAFVRMQKSYLPSLTEAQINELDSKYLVNMGELITQTKAWQQMDDNTRLICERIKTEKSQQGLNASQSRLNDANAAVAGATKENIEADTEGKRLENSLVQEYGEDSTKAALRAYNDAHTEAILDALMKAGRIKQEGREVMKTALEKANLRDNADAIEFLKICDGVKNGTITAEQVPPRWVDAVGSVAPWVFGLAVGVATKGRIKTIGRGIGKFMRGSGTPETNMSYPFGGSNPSQPFN